MIIHIDGIPGSGKTTLGKEISKKFNIDIIDFDDIIHQIKIKLVSKYNFDTCQIGTNKYKPDQIIKIYNHELRLESVNYLNEIIEKYTDKTLIITGCIRSDIKLYFDKGFYIKIDEELCYKQFNMRSLELIKDNYVGIKDIINSDISIQSKNIEIEVKYQIQSTFMSPFIHYREIMEKNSRRIGYKYATYNEIIKEIEQLFITDNL